MIKFESMVLDSGHTEIIIATSSQHLGDKDIIALTIHKATGKTVIVSGAGSNSRISVAKDGKILSIEDEK